MSKITTDKLRIKIAEYVTKEESKLQTLFVLSEDMESAKIPDNWKRISKRKEGRTWVREFDCRPYDDQLRAIVITDVADISVLELYISGE